MKISGKIPAFLLLTLQSQHLFSSVSSLSFLSSVLWLLLLTQGQGLQALLPDFQPLIAVFLQELALQNPMTPPKRTVDLLLPEYFHPLTEKNHLVLAIPPPAVIALILPLQFLKAYPEIPDLVPQDYNHFPDFHHPVYLLHTLNHWHHILIRFHPAFHHLIDNSEEIHR